MAVTVPTLPRGDFPWVDPKTGKPTQVFLLYMTSLAQGYPGWNLINAANDAAAATAGVAIGQIYRNGSVLQIRVT